MLTLALIEASGVRRSWLTAASSAVRILLPAASASAWAAWVRSRSRSSAAAACAANPSSSRGGTGRGWPERISVRSARTWLRVTGGADPGLGDTGPLAATVTHWPPASSRSSAVPPRVWVRCASTAAGVSAPLSTVWASPSSSAASSVLRAASRARCAARCTTLLTVTATVTNSSSASRLCGSAIVSVCTGGVKYQFSKTLAVTAASTAGQKPPTMAIATTTTR